MGIAFDPIAEYKARTKKSAEWFEQASKHLPGGVTGNVKYYAPYPVYAKRAKGGHLWDLDGNEYVDYMLCFGPLILGHGHPKVLAAVRDQLERDGAGALRGPRAAGRPGVHQHARSRGAERPRPPVQRPRRDDPAPEGPPGGPRSRHRRTRPAGLRARRPGVPERPPGGHRGSRDRPHLR